MSSKWEDNSFLNFDNDVFKASPKKSTPKLYNLQSSHSANKITSLNPYSYSNNSLSQSLRPSSILLISRYHPETVFNLNSSHDFSQSRSQVLSRSKSVSEHKVYPETQKFNGVGEKQRLTLSQILAKTKKSPVKGSGKVVTPTKNQKMSLEKSPLKRENQVIAKEENNIQNIMSFIEKFRLEKQKTLEQNQHQQQVTKIIEKKKEISTPKKITPKKSTLTTKSTEESKQKPQKVNKPPKSEEQKRKEYQDEMKKSQNQRMQILLESLQSKEEKTENQFFKAPSVSNTSIQEPDPFMKYLLSYRFYQSEPYYLPTIPIPNKFNSFNAYQQTFQNLVINECVSHVKNGLEGLLKDKPNRVKPVCNQYRIRIQIDNPADNFVILELFKPNDQENNNKITPSKEPMTPSKTNISTPTFPNNSLVLISSSENVSLDQVNKEDSLNDFTIVGFISHKETRNIFESTKIHAVINGLRLKQKLKTGWVDCYIQHIEKISTFLREYNNLKDMGDSDLIPHILDPQNKNLHHQNNQTFNYNTLYNKFNPGQLATIKDICQSNNRVCLLQGPPGTGKTHTLLGIVSSIYHHLKHVEIFRKKYIMICTPSNAAIDEIILKIQRNGLYAEDGSVVHPRIVRIGILEKDAPDSVRDCSLEEMAFKEMNRLKSKSPAKGEFSINLLREEIDKVLKLIEICKPDTSDAGKEKISSLLERKKNLYDQYHDYKAFNVNEKERYKQITQNILISADIICCTLSSAGSEKLSRFKDYIEAVIVDEATQCTESSNVIPLKYSPKKLVLIGDPQQLPATVLSPNAMSTKFNRSLFERITHCGIKPYFLYEQYRMVANIRKFPSLQFYNNQLQDSLTVRQRNWPDYLDQFQAKNLLFIDLEFATESLDDYSYYNKAELAVCSSLLDYFIQKINHHSSCPIKKDMIGCISPYKKQTALINEQLRNKYRDKYKNCISVNTVDAFQGQEKDVIILSTVRASPNITDEQSSIGFLNDIRRLNVAITRSKFVLIILGNSKTLSTKKIWKDYFQYLLQNQSYIRIPQPQDLERTLSLYFEGITIPRYLDLSPDPSSLRSLKIQGSNSKSQISSAKSSLSKASTKPSPIQNNHQQLILPVNWTTLKARPNPWINQNAKVEKIEKKIKIEENPFMIREEPPRISPNLKLSSLFKNKQSSNSKNQSSSVLNQLLTIS